MTIYVAIAITQGEKWYDAERFLCAFEDEEESLQNLKAIFERAQEEITRQHGDQIVGQAYWLTVRPVQRASVIEGEVTRAGSG